MHSKQLAKHLTQIHLKKLTYTINECHGTPSFISLPIKPLENDQSLTLMPDKENPCTYKLQIFMYYLNPCKKPETHTLPQEFTLNKNGDPKQIEQIYKAYFDWVNTRIKNNIDKILKENNL